jgi:uncharacterized protein
MTEAEKIIADLKRLEPRLRAKGVTHLAIFGSRARGDNRPDSDLDVLIDVDENSKFSLITLSGVQLDIQDETGVETHVTMNRGLKSRFQETITEDAKVVF